MFGSLVKIRQFFNLAVVYSGRRGVSNAENKKAEKAVSFQLSALSLSREKDSRQMAVGSKCGTTDYRTTEKINILNRTFTQINTDNEFFTAKRMAQSGLSTEYRVLSTELPEKC